MKSNAYCSCGGEIVKAFHEDIFFCVNCSKLIDFRSVKEHPVVVVQDWHRPCNKVCGGFLRRES